MSKIVNAKGRTDGDSGYTRVLGNEELGQLISKVQSTVISNGSELERIILGKSNIINDLNNFIDDATDGKISDGVYVCPKRNYAKSKYLIYDNEKKKIEPDLLIFVVERRRICKVVELKDGDAFDTKKSAVERTHLEEFIQKFGAKIPFVTEYYICCFNQNNKDIIYTGFKGCFTKEHILTGRELCEILKISYDEIIKKRQEDAKENFDYFVSSILGIPEIMELIKEKIKQN